MQAPRDGYLMAPGYSMLFAVGQGDGGPVPSVAHMVHLEPAAPNPSPPA